MSEVRGIDLRALQLAAEVDVHGFPFREDIECGGAGLAMAVSGGLGAAEGQVDLGTDGRSVDVEDAGVHVSHRRKGAIDVPSVYRSRQPILHAVAYRDRLFE